LRIEIYEQQRYIQEQNEMQFGEITINGEEMTRDLLFIEVEIVG
jgi:hypothetical protein